MSQELQELHQSTLENIREMVEREDEEEIHNDPLSVRVRSDWTEPGATLEAYEFEILLSTGGPASRIIGSLDEHQYPDSASLEVQDWFKPWTTFFESDEDQEVLLKYAGYFFYG